MIVSLILNLLKNLWQHSCDARLLKFQNSSSILCTLVMIWSTWTRLYLFELWLWYKLFRILSKITLTYSSSIFICRDIAYSQKVKTPRQQQVTLVSEARKLSSSISFILILKLYCLLLKISSSYFKFTSCVHRIRCYFIVGMLTKTRSSFSVLFLDPTLD